MCMQRAATRLRKPKDCILFYVPYFSQWEGGDYSLLREKVSRCSVAAIVSQICCRCTGTEEIPTAKDALPRPCDTERFVCFQIDRSRSQINISWHNGECLNLTTGKQWFYPDVALELFQNLCRHRNSWPGRANLKCRCSQVCGRNPPYPQH